jgi:two-component system LytT family sensor kinase
MDPEKAKGILAGRGKEGSVGLANVDHRLRNVYGPWFGLVVETAVARVPGPSSGFPDSIRE